MSGASTSRTVTRRRPSRQHIRDLDIALTAELCRTIVGVAFALVRGTHLRKQTILQAFSTALALMPDEPPLTSSHPSTRATDAAHLLHIWTSQNPYLLHGKPRPLYVRGRAPSIESLVQEFAPHLELSTVMDIWLASHSLQKVGRRFVPSTVVIRTRGTKYQAQQHLEALAAVVANFDHNSTPPTSWPSWRAQAAENPELPVKELPKWTRHIFKQSEPQLRNYDAHMRRFERSRGPLDLTTRAGVLILQYERSYREQSPALALTLRRMLRQLGIESSSRTGSSHGSGDATRRHQRSRE